MNSAHPSSQRRTYFFTFLGLLILTALTTGVAYVDLGPFSTVVAIAIAGVKTMLIVLFFMHLYTARRLDRLFAIAGLFWLVIMFSLTFSDFVTRGWIPVPGK